MNPTDTIIALEKALEAGPTPGPWFTGRTGLFKVATITSTTGIYADQMPDENAISSDATWIAACSPLAIRTLLDAHASALRDAERLRTALSEAHSVCDSVSMSVGRKVILGECVMYAQTVEWCHWVEDEVEPMIRAALDDNTKGAAPELADLGINGSRCGTHGTSGS